MKPSGSRAKLEAEETLENPGSIARVPKVQGRKDRISQAKGQSRAFRFLCVCPAMLQAGPRVWPAFSLFLSPNEAADIILSSLHEEEMKMQTVLNIVQKINLTLSDYVLIVLFDRQRVCSSRSRRALCRCAASARAWRRVFGKISLNGGRQAKRLEFVPGAGHRGRRAGRHGQYHRRVRCDFDRRPRRDLLDVDHRVLRHGDHLCRGGSGTGDACRRSRRLCPRRPRVLY